MDEDSCEETADTNSIPFCALCKGKIKPTPDGWFVHLVKETCSMNKRN